MWSRDELTGGNVLNPVTALHRRTTAEMSVLSLLVEDEAGPLLLAAAGAANDNAPRVTHEVRLTPEHPVYVAGRNGEALGWVMAGELVPGDLIADIDGGALVKVVSNTLTETSETVYNFEVENAHSYFADELGLWAHNARLPNKLLPDPVATGDHIVFRRDRSGRVVAFQTFFKNSCNPSGFQAGPRFRGSGKPHGGVEPPMIILPSGRARPALPDELPGGFE